MRRILRRPKRSAMRVRNVPRKTSPTLFCFCFLVVVSWECGGFCLDGGADDDDDDDDDLQSHGHEETDSTVGETEFSEE